MNNKDYKLKKEENRFIKDIQNIIFNSEAVKIFIEENYNKYFNDLPDGEYKIKLLNVIYKRYLKSDMEIGTHPITITQNEIKFLQSLPNELIKKLFYSLIVRAKVKPHISGWVSLDFENTIFYALEDNKAKNAKIEIYSQCTEYGFDTLVRGSTKPVLCFKLPDFGESDIIFEFTDGEARDKFKEVINYDSSD